LDGFVLHGPTEPIGRVRKSHLTGDRPYLIVKTGFIVGKTECIPIGLIDDINTTARTLHIAYTRDIVSNAPEPAKGEVDPVFLTKLERYWRDYVTG
jgi:hypothetical protein